MGWVTQDQIERARQVDVLDYILRHEPDKVKRVGSVYRMKDHPSFEIGSGRWRWYSHGMFGKTALDYLTDVHGYSFVDAVCHLIGEWPHEKAQVGKLPIKTKQTPKIEATLTPERHPFSIPRHNKDNNRVIAYMQSRGIDRGLILDCIERGDLYESAYKHDYVFKGKDENGRTRFATVRSTTTQFKGDVAGSDKQYSFLISASDMDSATVAVFESPIDSLSHQSLCLHGYLPRFNGWRLSLGGTSTLGLMRFLGRNPQVSHCLVCADADEAGDLLAAKIAEIDGISSERSFPSHGKDWNEMLQIIQKTERAQNRAYTRPHDERM